MEITETVWFAALMTTIAVAGIALASSRAGRIAAVLGALYFLFRIRLEILWKAEFTAEDVPIRIDLLLLSPFDLGFSVVIAALSLKFAIDRLLRRFRQ